MKILHYKSSINRHFRAYCTNNITKHDLSSCFFFIMFCDCFPSSPLELLRIQYSVSMLTSYNNSSANTCIMAPGRSFVQCKPKQLITRSRELHIKLEDINQT